MNKEIKEILDYFKRDDKNNFGYNQAKILNDEQAKLLLDYITNLQQENKEWGMIFDTFSSRPYAHRYLEEKRKELGNKRIIGLDSEMIYKDYYDYKSRCEKAIEYINKLYNLYYEQGINFEIMYKSQVDNLLNILQNGSENDE